MTTSFGALCTDFFINQKLAVKMELPGDRETVMHMFDRVRAEMPAMSRFKRFADELALESPRREGEYQWLALRAQSVRSGHVNPRSMPDGYRLHRLIAETCPFFLTISPLDVDHLELTFGFDLECKANHHQIVREALLGDSGLAALVDLPGARPLDVQPVIGVALDTASDLHAFFEVKTRTSLAQVRADRYRTEPISIFLTVRKNGPIQKIDELPGILDELIGQCEQLATGCVIPQLVHPISRAILGSV